MASRPSLAKALHVRTGFLYLFLSTGIGFSPPLHEAATVPAPPVVDDLGAGPRGSNDAAALLERTLRNRPPFRVKLTRRVWPEGDNPESAQDSDPRVFEFILTVWDEKHWSLLQTGSQDGMVRENDVFIQTGPPSAVNAISRNITETMWQEIQLALQSAAFGCMYSHGADPIAALRNEAGGIRQTEEAKRVSLEFDHPGARAKDGDMREAAGLERDRGVCWRVGLVIELEDPPRLAEDSFALVKGDGEVVPWARRFVAAWENRDGSWIGRRVVGIGHSTPGKGQRTEMAIDQIENLEATAAVPTLLPTGTMLYDSAIGLMFTIGSPNITLTGQRFVLKEPLNGHPGENLGALLEEATSVEVSRPPASPPASERK